MATKQIKNKNLSFYLADFKDVLPFEKKAQTVIVILHITLILIMEKTLKITNHNLSTKKK